MKSSDHALSSASYRLGLLAVVSAVVLGIGCAVVPERIWSNLLIVGVYLVTLALGGALFIALTYVANASWNVAFRRVPEAMAIVLAPAGLGLLAVLAARCQKYAWHPHSGETDAGTFWFKELWTTPTFWMIRSVAYIAVWLLLSRMLVAASRRQDFSNNLSLTLFNRRLSAVFLLVYAPTFALASCDWLMLLDPMWFSTVFGVYNFAGMVQATLAATIILAIILRRRGPLRGIFTDDHLHDLGKLLLGFSCFWMYIWFSQYMLIWYTNMPEETSYYLLRTRGPWGPLMVANLALNWIIPFFTLLPRPWKRNESIMLKIAAVVLLGRWLDLYIMVFPAIVCVIPTGELKNPISPSLTTPAAAAIDSTDHRDRLETPSTGTTVAPVTVAEKSDSADSLPTPMFGIWEAAGGGLIVGFFGWWFFRAFANAPPVPDGDPLLAESLHYHC